MINPEELPSTKSRPYNIWAGMKARCNNPNATVYKEYGARGITYCKRWESFMNFWDDMGLGYSANLTLERIDNNRGYSPENCKWATPKEQANNRRNSRYFVINGVKKTLAQWIEYYKLKGSTVKQRYYGYNWPIEKALGIGAKNV